MHTEQSVRELVAQRLMGRRFVVVSNREPFIHRWQDGEVTCSRPAGGVTTALDPLLRATAGLWVAHASGDADRDTSDARGRVAVPPGDCRYTLKRVWLDKDQEKLYYDGLANQALWPLCHVAYERPAFEESQWQAYRQVNQIFARAVAEEIGDDAAFVFIQDYHFGLLPQYLKQLCPRVATAQFWHIPWPNLELFRIFPWKQELLAGLLHNDVLCFHLRSHCANFAAAVANVAGASVSAGGTHVRHGPRHMRLEACPVGVDVTGVGRSAESIEVRQECNRLRSRYGLDAEFLAIGVDRLDYTKGIPERVQAVDRFLTLNPEYRRRFIYFQVGAPSRTRIPAYQRTSAEIERIAAEVNHRHGCRGWQPVVLAQEEFGPTSVYALYRMARLCVVSSLDDGMNLVAKEFVCARTDERGVLVLSAFAGAAAELGDALLINPYFTPDLSAALRRAMEMDPVEMQARMRRMRAAVRRHNVYDWAAGVLQLLFEARSVEDSLATPRYTMAQPVAAN